MTYSRREVGVIRTSPGTLFRTALLAAAHFCVLPHERGNETRRLTARPVDSLSGRPMRRLVILGIGAVGFGLLLVLNVGGYRYGISDQAFYIPVVLQHMTPDLYPHDASLIGAQDRFFLFDDWFASLLHATGVSIPMAFLVGYGVTLLLLFGAIVAIGRAMYASWWTVAALAIGVTIRHRIPDTAVNTFESYFHPRLLAFTIGFWAVAALLRGRTRLALCITTVALLAHPTTGLWFVIWVGSAVLVADRAARPALVALVTASAATAVWTLIGPLRSQLVVMDAAWWGALSSKDYLIATNWPLVTWVGSLAVAVLIAAIYRYRRAIGIRSPTEDGLVVGCAVLLGLFLLSVPAAAAHVALVVQLQFNRIFWILDIFASCYLVWLLVESPVWARARAAWLRVTPRLAIVSLMLLLALARGGYVMLVERAGQPIVQPQLAANDWHDVMSWASRQPVGTHFLAEPDHASRYGTSVRAASGRDVYLEIIGDTGIAIYSEEIANRLSERLSDLGDFESLDASRALILAHRYELDFLITEHSLSLPETRRTGRFHIYDLDDRNQLATSVWPRNTSALRDH